MIKYTSSEKKDPLVGYGLTAALFFRHLILTISTQHQSNELCTASIRIRNALINLLYKKVIKTF